MATLNLSSNGSAITKSYQSVVDAPLPSGAAAGSNTYGQWAVYTVQAPLLSAFSSVEGKDSVLKVQSTGEGELVDLVEEFSDGRIQFAFCKVKDDNSGLPKNVLIGWCGEGVPERTKGYFTSYLAAVAKLLHGYHVQIVARTDNDLTPQAIIRKVADASGSKYSGGGGSASSSDAPPAPTASKPAFQPSRQSGGGASAFNPLGSRSRAAVAKDETEDNDGWGADAPDVTRRQLTKVESAYKPTRVNMAELTSQKPEASRFKPAQEEPSNADPDVVRGGYQPIGKVDIAALRRQAQDKAQDDRPTTVRGAYEPVGKVDIAAIRAKAQPSSPSPAATPARSASISQDAQDEDAPKSLAERSAAFSQSERLSSMPKPKVANKFGSTTTSFAGTKAPSPMGFSSKSIATSAPIGMANKNFAEQGGKTPAQLWAERKAKQGGAAPSGPVRTPSSNPPIASQQSGGSEWKSGYSGKSWGAVQTGVRTQGSISQQGTGEPEEEHQEEEDTSAPAGGVGSIRDRFKQAAPMGAPLSSRGQDEDEEEESAPHPPPMDFSSKPNARGVPMPGFASRQPEPDQDEEDIPVEEPSRMPVPPPQPPRSPTPDEDSRPSSPIRIAMPVGRTAPKPIEPEGQFSPPPAMPLGSLAKVVPDEEDLDDEPVTEANDTARTAAQITAASSFGPAAVISANPGAKVSGKRAIVQYDYEKAEENELELKEGETVTNIEMVDDDWWMGENSRGESGLFPSNYVELVEGDESHASAPAAPSAPIAPAAGPAGGGAKKGPTATAQYDYEAVEDNELSFPDGAKIGDLEFPDDDWWMGSYGGRTGLFPANYVTLDE